MRKITYAEAINETLREMMRKDERIFIMGEDIGRYGGVFQVTKGLLDEFGEERIIDTPISEAGFVGAGTGAALTGMRPVVELMFIDFTTLAMDQIVNQAAKIHYMFGGKAKIPLVLRTNIGAGRGAAAQHSQSLHAWFVHAPGLKVVLPSSSYDVKGLLVTAIEDDNPVMFIEHKMLYYTEGEVPEELYSIPFGKGEVKREGKDLTIVALSSMVGKALRAAEDLAKNGIDVEVVDPRTLVPLDEAIIFDSVKKTGRLLVADEGHKRCGIGAEIAATVSEKAFDYLDAPILRVAAPDVPVPFSHPLEEAYIPDEEDIKRACHELFTK